jgi:peptide-methionine (S)-S-oxide reductase
MKVITLPNLDSALTGRDTPMSVPEQHHINGNPLRGPFEGHLETAVFGLGCFWGAEQRFWQVSGVFSTAVGYAGGLTPNPDYGEVCSGATGHAEVVQVVYDRAAVDFDTLLSIFWEAHDPTQGMQQGNDVGTQYRSAIYTLSDEQNDIAQRSRSAYQARLSAAGHGKISTEIETLDTFYFAEDYHQQYLAKNPGGYCGLSGTGISCA